MNKLFNKTFAWIIFMVPIVFLCSFVLHFLYDWTSNNVIIGAFVPIDESIWEHTKLTFFPLIILYVIFYFLIRRKKEIDANKWFTCMLINIFASFLLVCMLYYFVRYGLGIESLIVNIIILLISLCLSAFISCHFYIHGRGINLIFSICIICFMIYIYILFTYSKCDLPIFFENRQII